VQSLVKEKSGRLVIIRESIVKTSFLEQSELKNESYQYYLNMFEDKVIVF